MTGRFAVGWADSSVKSRWRGSLTPVIVGAGAAVAALVLLIVALPQSTSEPSQMTSPVEPDPVRTGPNTSSTSEQPGLTSSVEPDPIITAPQTVSTRRPLDDPPDPGPAPDDHGFATAELAALVGSSVRVAGPACRNIMHEGSGFAVSGFAVSAGNSDDGDRGNGDLIVTNAHLMVGMQAPTVELADGRVLDAVPVALDLVNDLAVLRAEGAGLLPLPLTEAVPDGTVGAVLAWEASGEPDPTPFRIDRPVTVRTEAVAGKDRIERSSWLLAAEVETGDSGAALVASVDGQAAALGVVWSASRRGGVDVAYATRAGAVKQLLESSNLNERVSVPPCP